MDVVSRVRVSGPLAGYAAGFAAHLAGAGYTPLSAANQVRVLAHLSRWMEDRGLAPGELAGPRAEEFLAARRAAGYTCWLSGRGLAPLLGYLRGLGVAPEPACPVPVSAVDVLAERYGGYLAGERGLVAGTVRYYLDEARGFLAGREDRLAGLTAAEVSGFTVAECRRRSTGSAKILVTALRSLLRFLALEGLAPPGLQGAVPAVAGWRAAEGAAGRAGRGAAGFLRPGHRHGPAGPRGPGAAVPAGAACLRGGRAGARRHQLAGRDRADPRQGTAR